MKRNFLAFNFILIDHKDIALINAEITGGKLIKIKVV